MEYLDITTLASMSHPLRLPLRHKVCPTLAPVRTRRRSKEKRMAEGNPNPGMGPGSVAAGALDRAAGAAHSVVDRAIGATAPAAQWLDQKTRAQQQRYEQPPSTSDNTP